jgi:S-adenosylmethionine synthetase
VNSFASNEVAEEQIEKAVQEVFSFKPADIVEQLDLLRPFYLTTTNYGHFGREDAGLPWEETNRVSELQNAVSA